MLTAIKYTIIIYNHRIDRQTDPSSQSFMLLVSGEPEHLKNIIRWNLHVHAEFVGAIFRCVQTLGRWSLMVFLNLFFFNFFKPTESDLNKSINKEKITTMILYCCVKVQFHKHLPYYSPPCFMCQIIVTGKEKKMVASDMT